MKFFHLKKTEKIEKNDDFGDLVINKSQNQ
jgi:hypothetical protein